MSRSGDEFVLGDDVAQWLLGRLGDADAWRDFNVAGAEAILDNEEVRAGACQVLSVVAFSRNSERLSQPAGSAGQLPQVGDAVVRIHGHAPRLRHLSDSFYRLECAEQDSSSLSIRQAGDVEQEMIAVNEVNVRTAGRSE